MNLKKNRSTLLLGGASAALALAAAAAIAHPGGQGRGGPGKGLSLERLDSDGDGVVPGLRGGRWPRLQPGRGPLTRLREAGSIGS
ncbi:MAG: hypothetical protein AAFZ18_33205, partial [Myxococcota bacterium]